MRRRCGRAKNTQSRDVRGAQTRNRDVGITLRAVSRSRIGQMSSRLAT